MARRKKHEEHVNHERWLVSYADFITLLFAFFVVMFAVSQVDENKVGRFTESIQAATRWGVFQQQGSPTPTNQTTGVGAGVVSGPGPVVRQMGPQGIPGLVIRQLLERRLGSVLANGQVSLVEVDSGIIVRLKDAAFFDTASADLRSQSVDAIGLVADSIADLPNDVRVEGHTDQRPIRTSIFRSNWDLSAARAASVLAFFSEHGIAESRLSVAGYASLKPIASNDTAEGRRQNRRVDIVILAPQSGTGEAQPRR